MRVWPGPNRIIVVGAALAIAGLVAMGMLGGVDAVQGTSTPEAFAAGALGQGNDVRWASWADFALFVPGVLVFSLGIVLRIRGEGDDRRRRAVARVGFVSIGLLAVFDQTENLTLQLGLGTVDLDAADAVLRPSQTLVDVFHFAHDVKWVAVGGLLTVAIGGFVLRVADRTGE